MFFYENSRGRKSLEEYTTIRKFHHENSIHILFIEEYSIDLCCTVERTLNFFSFLTSLFVVEFTRKSPLGKQNWKKIALQLSSGQCTNWSQNPQNHKVKTRGFQRPFWFDRHAVPDGATSANNFSGVNIQPRIPKQVSDRESIHLVTVDGSDKGSSQNA